MIVLWRVTEVCNLACGFCAYDRSVERSRAAADREQVSRFARLLGAFHRQTGERVMLSWLGGEPLLWPPLFGLSQELREAHGIELSATSNGSTLYRNSVIEQIVQTFSEFTVSVDGPAAFHDRMRGRTGLWQRLCVGVVSLDRRRREIETPLKLRANVVLMRDNLPLFADLCEELADWGIDEITFNQLGGRDRPEFFPDHGLRLADVASLRQSLTPLRQRLAARGVQLCGSATYLDRLEASARQQALPVADCAPGEQFLFVDESGRVAPCSFSTAEYGVPVDELQTVDDLVGLRGRFRASQARSAAAACGDCPSNHVFAKFASA